MVRGEPIETPVTGFGGLTARFDLDKPVIAAIQGACYGAGIDLITACDIRHATADATFSVKEVDLGIVADVGTLQRLPPGNGP